MNLAILSGMNQEKIKLAQDRKGKFFGIIFVEVLKNGTTTEPFALRQTLKVILPEKLAIQYRNDLEPGVQLFIMGSLTQDSRQEELCYVTAIKIQTVRYLITDPFLSDFFIPV